MSMVNSYRAIIVRSFFPVKNKIALISAQQGYHYLIASRYLPNIQGALCEYHIKDGVFKNLIERQELLFLPDAWALEDLAFVHFVLELLYLLLPESSNPQGLFNHLLLLYKPMPLHLARERYKKLFICRIFSLLGVYPEDNEQYDEKFLCLISAPIDIMLNMQTLIFYYDVDAWIGSCARTHPQANSIKTFYVK